jgi:DNA-binding MurR/RpiR family transcriptional regulator
MSAPASPSSIDEFLDRLRAIAPALPKRLAQCAAHLAAHTDRIAVSTVAEMAAGAGVPPSALMRLCKQMGFSGYSQMQRLFRASYAQNWPDYGTRLAHLRDRGADSPAALLAEFAEAGRKSLAQLANTVDPQVLEQAAKQLASARMIHVIGLRRAFPVASYLTYVFEKMDMPAFLHDGVGKLDHRHAMRPGDVVIAITFAPYSDETVAIAAHGQAMDLPVIAMTDTAASPVMPFADMSLMVTEVDFGAFRALSATLSLAVALAVSAGAIRRGMSTKNV